MRRFRPTTAGVSLALVLALVLLQGAIACGSDDESVAADPDGSSSDAGAGEGQSNTTDSGGAPDTSVQPDTGLGDASDGGFGFSVQSPTIEIAAGEESVYCYYFHTSNTQELNVKSFQSTLGAGVMRASLLFTNADKMPPGTLSTTDCTMIASAPAGAIPTWVYSAFTPQASLSLPSDDGAGKPVGKPVKPAQPAYLVVHVLNGTSAKINTQVELVAAAYAPGTVVTQAEPYVTWNDSISIAPNAMGVVESQTCDVPSGSQFPWMSMLAHKQLIHAHIKDGPTTTVFETTDWMNPGAKAQSAAPFQTFATNKVTYQCDYNNLTNRTIEDGDSPKLDEKCMLVSYHFPATKPRLCFNSLLLP